MFVQVVRRFAVLRQFGKRAAFPVAITALRLYDGLESLHLAAVLVKQMVGHFLCI